MISHRRWWLVGLAGLLAGLLGGGLAAGAAGSMPQASAEASAPSPVFLRGWGAENGLLDSPNGVAVGPDGSIYVTNYGLNLMMRYAPTDLSFTSWGGFGKSVAGKFYGPTEVAVDGTGRVYVVDALNYRVQRFARDGTYQTEWSPQGQLPNPNVVPSGLAAAPDGTIYLSYSGDEAVQAFDADGHYLLNLEPVFTSPLGVAVDPLGFIYVADFGNNRIDEFGSDGSLAQQWGGPGVAAGQFDGPTAVAADSTSVYVTDSDNCRVQKFTQAGVFVTQWGSCGPGDGQFAAPGPLAVDAAGNVLMADTGDDRIEMFSSSGVYLKQWGLPTSAPGQFNHPGGVAVDADGQVFVSDAKYRIQKFTPSGSYRLEWDGSGPSLGDFYCPESLAFDSERNTLYVADANNDRIARFSGEGAPLGAWGTYSTTPGLYFNGPCGVAVNVTGTVYVADTYNSRVQYFSSGGVYLGGWGAGTPLSTTGNFDRPFGIAVDITGTVVVADTYNHRIETFAGDGTFLNAWGSYGTGPGEFSYPSGVAVDASDRVYVADTANNRIQVFTIDGQYLTTWGQAGNAAGEFLSPLALAIGPQGQVVVADTDNDRLQEFSDGPPAPDPVSGWVQNGHFSATTPLEGWTVGGALSVTQSAAPGLGGQALLLGAPVTPTGAAVAEAASVTPTLEGQAWAYQAFYIDPDLTHPGLLFDYNLYVNDQRANSDFYAELRDTAGLNHLATVVDDGYAPGAGPALPAPGTNLGWRAAYTDLTAYRGQHLRLMLVNRNLTAAAKGIWTYVANVSVTNIVRLFLPVLARR